MATAQKSHKNKESKFTLQQFEYRTKPGVQREKKA